MINECEVNSDLYLSQTPQAPPGISGRLISKCRKLRLSYMASPAKNVISPTVYKIGAQVYLVRWYGTVPGAEAGKVDWQNAFFVRRKEVPVEDPKVQEALAATFVMLRMDQHRQIPIQYQYASSNNPWVTSSTYASASSGYWSASPYATATYSTYPYGLANQSYAQHPSSGWTQVKKILGIP